MVDVNVLLFALAIYWLLPWVEFTKHIYLKCIFEEVIPFCATIYFFSTALHHLRSK